MMEPQFRSPSSWQFAGMWMVPERLYVPAEKWTVPVEHACTAAATSPPGEMPAAPGVVAVIAPGAPPAASTGAPASATVSHAGTPEGEGVPPPPQPSAPLLAACAALAAAAVPAASLSPRARPESADPVVVPLPPLSGSVLPAGEALQPTRRRAADAKRASP